MLERSSTPICIVSPLARRCVVALKMMVGAGRVG